MEQKYFGNRENLIFPKLSIEELSKEDQAKLEACYKLPPEEIKKKVLSGLDFIGNETIGKAFSSSLEDRPFEKNETDFSINKLNAGKINLGELNTDDFALYLKRKKLIESLNLVPNKDDAFEFTVKFNNSHQAESPWFFKEDKNNNVKVSFDNSIYIHPDKFFSFGIYNSKNELSAILPFDGKNKDQKVSWNMEFIDKIYLREVEDSDVEKFFKDLAFQANQQMKVINEKLGIDNERRPKIDVLLSDEKKHKARAFNYLDEFNKRRGFIYLSKNRLKEESPNNQLRIFRHEYLHNMDCALGVDDNFSEKNKNKILAIASNILNQPIISLPNDEKIQWGDKNAVSDLFRESSFFDEGYEGHPTDNVREFFVSTMNIFLDPEFEKNLKNKSEKDQKKILEVANKIFDLAKSS